MVRAKRPYLFCVFAHLDEVIAAIKALKDGGHKEFLIYSPVPHHDIKLALGRKPSPVRVFTLAGGLLGLATGWAITIGSTIAFPIHVGGKPIVSLPPFSVVAYLLTILFGALATLLGMILNARLPQVELVKGYDPRVSSDHFGIQVFCECDDFAKVERLLSSAGASDVKRIDEYRMQNEK